MVLVEKSGRHLEGTGGNGLVYGRTRREYNVTIGQLFLENSIFLAGGPALLITGMIGLSLAKRQRGN